MSFSTGARGHSYLLNVAVAAATFALVSAVFLIIEFSLRYFSPNTGRFDEVSLRFALWAAAPPYRVERSLRGAVLVKIFPCAATRSARRSRCSPRSATAERAPAETAQRQPR